MTTTIAAGAASASRSGWRSSTDRGPAAWGLPSIVLYDAAVRISGLDVFLVSRPRGGGRDPAAAGVPHRPMDVREQPAQARAGQGGRAVPGAARLQARLRRGADQ